MASRGYPIEDFWRGTLLKWIRAQARKYAKDHDADVAQAICAEVRRELSKSSQKNFSKDDVQHAIISMSQNVFRKEDFANDPQLADWMLRVARGYASLEEDAKDLRQKAHVKLTKSRRKAVQKAFVRTVIRSCWYVEINRRRKMKKALQYILTQRLLQPRPPEEASAEVKNASDALAAVLPRLPHIYRVVVIRRYLSNPPFSVETTASTLGITPSAVKQRSLRALRKLRLLLERYWREAN